MRAPATGGRIAALGLAWLAGVASQLHERDLLRGSTYLGLGSLALLVFGAAWLGRRDP